MPSSVTITYVVREQWERRDSTYPVRIRITFKRKQKYISTNISVEKHQLTRSMEIKDPAVSESVQALIRDMRAVVNTLDPYMLESMDVDVVAALISKGLAGSAQGFALDFPTFFEKVASEKSKTVKANFMSAIHALSAFLGQDHFDISCISSSMMRRFERHLVEKHGSGARAVSLYTKTIAYVHRRAREEYNNEESDEILIRNPFEYYKPPRQKPAAHRNIDADIIRGMITMRKDLNGCQRLGVDLFLISFALMGMNTPDIYFCAKPKGDVIIYQRAKTKDRRADKAEMHVRIEPSVAPLLEEYMDYGKFAFMFHNKYADYRYLAHAANNGLAEFAKKIHIPKMTIYYARHTWASIAYSIGIDKATINDCLCHVDDSMRVTDTYIKKDWRILWEANKKVLGLFDWAQL